MDTQDKDLNEAEVAELKKEIVALKARNELLAKTVTRFSRFFSPDDVEHWQLSDLANGLERIEANSLKEYLEKVRERDNY